MLKFYDWLLAHKVITFNIKPQFVWFTILKKFQSSVNNSCLAKYNIIANNSHDENLLEPVKLKMNYSLVQELMSGEYRSMIILWVTNDAWQSVSS